MYLMRLDDASEYMDIEKWRHMEIILDKYSIKPIYGIIPNNQDSDLLQYGYVDDFWNLMRFWKSKNWIPALHGYTHVFETNDGGINPINNRSEFAGVDFNRQCQKIRDGYEMLINNGVDPMVFFAPAHTFDNNTLKALEQESEIRVINDTIANDVYYKNPFYFIPQQSGHVRRLPFNTVTFCYHPNIMSDADFKNLDNFLSKNAQKFGVFSNNNLKKRKKTLKDWVLEKMYFARKK